MAKRFDICTPRPKRDGGTFWVKIGTAWEGDKGVQLVFDALPIPDAEGRCVANLFEPREQNSGGQRRQRETMGSAGMHNSDAHPGGYDDEEVPGWGR